LRRSPASGRRPTDGPAGCGWRSAGCGSDAARSRAMRADRVRTATAPAPIPARHPAPPRPGWRRPAGPCPPPPLPRLRGTLGTFGAALCCGRPVLDLEEVVGVCGLEPDLLAPGVGHAVTVRGAV